MSSIMERKKKDRAQEPDHHDDRKQNLVHHTCALRLFNHHQWHFGSEYKLVATPIMDLSACAVPNSALNFPKHVRWTK